MDIVQVVGLGLVTAAVLLVVRQTRPELALLLSLAGGTVILAAMFGRMVAVIEVLESLTSKANIDALYLGTVLKIIGITYIADFGSQVLADAGEKALSAKVEMAGKVLILLMALPVLMAILDTLLKMLA